MAVTATGAMGVRASAIKTLLSESSTFQTMVGAANATAALAFIHVVFLEDDDTIPPFAVIGFDGDLTRTVVSSSPDDFSFFDGVETVITILDVIAPENLDDKEDAFYDFDNKTEAILDEIAAISQSTGKLVITSVRSGEIAFTKAEESRGPRGWFMQRMIRITA